MTIQEKIDEIKTAFDAFRALDKKYPEIIKAFVLDNKSGHFEGFFDIDKLQVWVDLDKISKIDEKP